MAKRTCSVDGCDKPSHARGWCRSHYNHWYVFGDPTVPTPQPRMSDLERVASFEAKIDRSDGCWLWTGCVNRQGYGSVRTADGSRRAHRVAYELYVGPIPPGLQLDHLCRVRHCVRPDHLEPVTNAENARRGLVNQNKQLTTCSICGGPFQYHYIGANGNVWRRCVPCHNERHRKYRAAGAS